MWIGYGLLFLLIALLVMKWYGYHIQGTFVADNRPRYKFDTAGWLPGTGWLHKKPDREAVKKKELLDRLKANVPRYLSPLWFPAATDAPGQAPING